MDIERQVFGQYLLFQRGLGQARLAHDCELIPDTAMVVCVTSPSTKSCAQQCLVSSSAGQNNLYSKTLYQVSPQVCHALQHHVGDCLPSCQEECPPHWPVTSPVHASGPAHQQSAVELHHQNRDHWGYISHLKPKTKESTDNNSVGLMLLIYHKISFTFYFCLQLLEKFRT